MLALTGRVIAVNSMAQDKTAIASDFRTVILYLHKDFFISQREVEDLRRESGVVALREFHSWPTKNLLIMNDQRKLFTSDREFGGPRIRCFIPSRV